MKVLEVTNLSRNRQPKREFQAESYGQATELDTLQGAAPMAEIDEPEVGTPQNVPVQPQNLGNLIQDAYRATERPLEAPTTRLSATDAPFMANDADMVLQAMYRVLPSKEIAALLRIL